MKTFCTTKCKIFLGSIKIGVFLKPAMKTLLLHYTTHASLYSKAARHLFIGTVLGSLQLAPQELS